ncbi:MAG TPA: NADH-quinone oxidoreductase subunit NuoH [Coriobacteriia bacterium]|nr:MAG: NADH-quinone oxidoreductase subunit H [Actinobacteria bacterium 66_15]HAL30401.1 NADH-quinone oxidoreductase subunit NuoH [Coriobacteriia bacterium]
MSPALEVVVKLVSIIGLMLTNGVFMIYLLRKVLGHLHIRLGPMHVGPHGILQTMNDVIKLLTKEDLTPRLADKALFYLAPMIVFVPSFMAYLALPFSDTLKATSLETGLLFTLAALSVVPIGILLAGWSSGNKWGLLGGMRSAAMQIAYEVPLLLSVLPVVMLAGTTDLGRIVEAQAGVHLGFIPAWFIANPLLWPSFVIFVIASLIEVNQTPFDMSEAESELVAGFGADYTAMKFGLIYLSEFSNTFIVSAIGVTLFFGGWLVPWIPMAWYDAVPVLAPTVFILKTYLGIVFMWWIRGTYPRVRIDQLMDLGWKRLIPAALVMIVLTGVMDKLIVPLVTGTVG